MIEKAWQTYKDGVLSGCIPESEIDAHRYTFYIGASTALKALFDASKDGTREEFVEIIDAVMNEIGAVFWKGADR